MELAPARPRPGRAGARAGRDEAPAAAGERLDRVAGGPLPLRRRARRGLRRRHDRVGALRRRAGASSRAASSTTARAASSAARASCANCMMTVDGVPNVRVCVEPVREGAVVEPQNVLGSLERDLLAVTDKVGGPFTPVGFYYRTMIRPRGAWPLYESFLRNVAGPRAARQARRSRRRYDTEHRRAEVLVSAAAGRAARRRAPRRPAAPRRRSWTRASPRAARRRPSGSRCSPGARARDLRGRPRPGRRR